MVALTEWIESQQPDVEPENRVWDFLGEPPNCVRRTLVQVAECDREMSIRLYDSRRGPSLAQSRDAADVATEHLKNKERQDRIEDGLYPDGEVRRVGVSVIVDGNIDRELPLGMIRVLVIQQTDEVKGAGKGQVLQDGGLPDISAEYKKGKILLLPGDVMTPKTDLRERVAGRYYLVEVVPEGWVIVDEAHVEKDFLRGRTAVDVYIYGPVD